MFWVAGKYNIPVLTIVLNNGGWTAPRRSLAAEYPGGLNQNATDDDIGVGLKPSPNYAKLASAAAGDGFEGRGLHFERCSNVEHFRRGLEKAVSAIRDGRGAFIEAIVD
jgi:thiamine pyrophosphate-dependent acetolactate synthase large subunit-like protein